MDKGFLLCSKCGKKILRRKPNGLFAFAFGRWNREEKVTVDGKETSLGAIVQIELFGSIRIKCFRWLCRLKHPNHWNEFTFFPKPGDEEK